MSAGHEFSTELKKYRLNAEEFERIKKLLGRNPKGIEWALFSALWSEHCSYKSSKVHLKKFFNQSKRVVGGAGENAGIVDLGEGEKVAFKMESHNHPSFIEPYQGAATGVGGILRDIFTMGARPIALANYLCFGEPEAPRMQSLVDGVVRGIGDYGNCVGVPMLTGQTEFHSSYNKNILVNAMAVGYFGPNDPITFAKAKGPGNYVVYVGAKTGGDGVHGASMASESFSSKDENKKPTIQIGDPFLEKLLIEACLEVIKSGHVVAIQDMGAAGLTSSSFEMASRGGVGFELDLSSVPLRDSRLTPEQILLSESQERMLLICEPSNFEKIRMMFHKWGLDAAVIGNVVAHRTVKLMWKGEVLTEIDPDLLVENAPQYERPYEVLKSDIQHATLQEPLELGRDGVLGQLNHVHSSSREWIYGQYDQRVGTQTERDCSSPIGVVRLPSGRKMGIALGGRPYIMRLDPYLAGIDSIAEPALQLAVRGFETVAVTDCLNYGNPENRRIMGEFVASLKGMNDMCREIAAPIISGNVSFYNETEGRNITSTPATGLVGLSTRKTLPTDAFCKEGLRVFLVTSEGLTTAGIASETSTPVAAKGRLETARIAALVHGLLSLEHVQSARMAGKSGLAHTLSRMCFEGIGATLQVDKKRLGGERLYEFVLCGGEELAKELKNLRDVTIVEIGTTGGERLSLSGMDFSISELKKNYEQGWRENFENLA
jgi:phosphoribosylformylglycinamidine synthase subunit PurL